MCVTPAGKIGNCTWGMPKLLPLRAKKVAFFTFFYHSKTVSSQFLFPPICRQEGIWSFEALEGRARISRLYRSQPKLHPKLWGSLPAWRENFDGLRRVRGESSDKQAHG